MTNCSRHSTAANISTYDWLTTCFMVIRIDCKLSLGLRNFCFFYNWPILLIQRHITTRTLLLTINLHVNRRGSRTAQLAAPLPWLVSPSSFSLQTDAAAAIAATQCNAQVLEEGTSYFDKWFNNAPCVQPCTDLE
jgi:hypothetical protein